VARAAQPRNNRPLAPIQLPATRNTIRVQRRLNWIFSAETSATKIRTAATSPAQTASTVAVHETNADAVQTPRRAEEA
jgi:hypothetical protein